MTPTTAPPAGSVIKGHDGHRTARGPHQRRESAAFRALVLASLLPLLLAGCEPTRQVSDTTLFLAPDGSIRAGSPAGASVTRAGQAAAAPPSQREPEPTRQPRGGTVRDVSAVAPVPVAAAPVVQPGRTPDVSRSSQARRRASLRPPAMPEVRINDCLPAAIAAQKTMQRNGVEARVLLVEWKEKGRQRGHAYTVFRYGKAYAYDKNYGSIPLASGTDWRNPDIVAMDANMRRGHFGPIVKAEFLEN
jgi:hypothetical protein